jgi:hypothetical protein
MILAGGLLNEIDIGVHVRSVISDFKAGALASQPFPNAA